MAKFYTSALHIEFDYVQGINDQLTGCLPATITINLQTLPYNITILLSNRLFMKQKRNIISFS